MLSLHGKNDGTNPMNTLAPSASLDPLAKELAAIVTDHAGDYPLVTFLDGPQEPTVAWLYARLTVDVFIRPGGHARIRDRESGYIALEVASLRAAMELLRRAESLCQKAEWPYVQLN
jgi:hypothetical protein